jgi:Cullin family
VWCIDLRLSAVRPLSMCIPQMVIFKYLEEKDVFQTFYLTKLSKHLIHGVSALDKAESSMISKLKEACSFEYMNKLQHMFTHSLVIFLYTRCKMIAH